MVGNDANILNLLNFLIVDYCIQSVINNREFFTQENAKSLAWKTIARCTSEAPGNFVQLIICSGPFTTRSWQ